MMPPSARNRRPALSSGSLFSQISRLRRRFRLCPNAGMLAAGRSGQLNIHNKNKRGDFMKRTTLLSLAGALIAASALTGAQAQISTKQQQAEQDAIDAKTPKLKYKEEVLQLKVPGQTMGEAVGVDTNSKGHIFVYSRTNPQGPARGGMAAMLWEFQPDGAFVKGKAPHDYAGAFAHSVRIDRHDDVWQVDEGSGMIVKYSPTGVPLEEFGRTPEAIDYLEEMLEK